LRTSTEASLLFELWRSTGRKEPSEHDHLTTQSSTRQACFGTPATNQPNCIINTTSSSDLNLGTARQRSLEAADHSALLRAPTAGHPDALDRPYETELRPESNHL